MDIAPLLSKVSIECRYEWSFMRLWSAHVFKPFNFELSKRTVTADIRLNRKCLLKGFPVFDEAQTAENLRNVFDYQNPYQRATLTLSGFSRRNFKKVYFIRSNFENRLPFIGIRQDVKNNDAQFGSKNISCRNRLDAKFIFFLTNKYHRRTTVAAQVLSIIDRIGKINQVPRWNLRFTMGIYMYLWVIFVQPISMKKKYAKMQKELQKPDTPIVDPV